MYIYVFTPFELITMGTGPWFNIKMSSYQYRKSHCGDKTILRPSYLHNGISYTGKTTSLYWIGAQVYNSFVVLEVDVQNISETVSLALMSILTHKFSCDCLTVPALHLTSAIWHTISTRYCSFSLLFVSGNFHIKKKCPHQSKCKNVWRSIIR